MSQHRLRSLFLGAALGLAPSSALADVVFDNFDANGGFDQSVHRVATHAFQNPSTPNYVATRAAARFTVLAGAYTLDSITLPISLFRDTPGDILRVRLAADAGGAPGATLEILSEDENLWPPHTIPFSSTTTLVSTVHTFLVPGESYWIVTEPTQFPPLPGQQSATTYRWFENTTGDTVAMHQQQVSAPFPSLPSDPWPGPSFQAALAFRVEGTLDHEPEAECLPVEDAGNVCDPQTGGCFGSVGYDYGIWRYEVTNLEYVDFLNAIAASDPNGVYNDWHWSITRSGSPGSYTYSVTPGGEDQPATAVTFYSALRYANWLHNGQPAGVQDATTTEDGAYAFSGPTSVGSRKATATFALPTEDEWYKAAYYDAVSSSYFAYPAASSVATSCTTPTALANSANCDYTVGDFTDVGSYPGSTSPYGTVDQGGNAWEWNATQIGSERGIRGGVWSIPNGFLAASLRLSVDPASDPMDTNLVGFRLVCLPEPGAWASLAGFALLALLAARRNSRHATRRR